MTEIFSIFKDNIISPPILFFILGVFAGRVKSDLDIPTQIGKYLSIYLMVAIGFKGGLSIMQNEGYDFTFFAMIIAGVGMSFLQPFLGYFFLNKTTKLDSPTAAAVSAHYGSISVVTFLAATGFLGIHNVKYAGYMIAVMALMEAPAIFSGLFIAHRKSPRTNRNAENRQRALLHEISTNGAILLLMGSFIIGMLTKERGHDLLSGFLVEPFGGMLCLFLLDMGLGVARRLESIKDFTLPLLAFGIYMPLMGAAIGLLISWAFNVPLGTGVLLMTLLASGSYIAVPAAMRLALPEAKPSIYLPMTLVITFPFNIMVGNPLYFTLAQKVLTP